MKLQKHKDTIITGGIVLMYALLVFRSLSYCYFWDNIQQISREAHWFYNTGFSSLLIPSDNANPDYAATGYHPPLMGMMTAALWKLFGQTLWVSHAFMLVWIGVLMVNTGLLLKKILPAPLWAPSFALLLLEPTILTQMVIASPDMILLAAFVWAVRATIDGKKGQLAVALLFLCGINMRGLFAGAVLFAGQIYYRHTGRGMASLWRAMRQTLGVYLPVILLLAAYYAYYLLQKGWFFQHEAADGHYAMPHSVGRIITHLAEYGLRSLENGRFLLWGLALWLLLKKCLRKNIQTDRNRTFLFIVFAGLTLIYLTFVFISQMPFSARYFMPQFFLMSVLVIAELSELHLSSIKRTAFFCIVVLVELSGHLWVYPDKIAKSWDCTLAHTDYYPLRKECFDYIDAQKISYNDISAGFCFYGTREITELHPGNGRIGMEPDRPYFLYSNISNLDDNLALELQDSTKWQCIKSFEKRFVEIKLMKKR